jgi:hypothetical protein
MNLKPIASNMTELTLGDKTILFSYETPVALRGERGICIKTSKHWSNTTSRHINQWFKSEIAQGCSPFVKPQEYFDSLVK